MYQHLYVGEFLDKAGLLFIIVSQNQNKLTNEKEIGTNEPYIPTFLNLI